MRISYKDYPILKSIEAKKLKALELSTDNISKIQFKNHYKRAFDAIVSDGKNPVYVLTQPFIASCFFDRLVLDKLSNFFHEAPTCKGTILYTQPSDNTKVTIVYNIANNGQEVSLEIFNFVGEFLFSYQNSIYDKKTEDLSVDEKSFFSRKDGEYFASFVLVFVLFKKFADVIEVLITKKKNDVAFNCKYLNETNKNIRIMDSTWFTTIRNSKGFNVRGHFRLQPFGEGLLQKRLVWINEYQKSGYTRLAKLLNPKFKDIN